MNFFYRLKKWYDDITFDLSASENLLYRIYYRYLFRPGEDTLAGFLNNYSRHRYPVTFLQIGANDGFHHDPLHVFIKRDNWKGVMLEPLPDVFNDYLIRLHRKRPAIKVINAALDKNDGTKTLYKLSFSSERWATGMSSFNREVLTQKISKGIIQHKARKRGIRLPENEDDWIVEQEIATISPETLLERYCSEGFSLLAIDTEGYDYEIIKMLDLNRISPEVIIYEEVNLDRAAARECRDYLDRHGYSCRSLGKDVVATKF